MGFAVLKGGLMTTVQDAGRRNYQRYGMTVSGAVDVHSFRYANYLVGNRPEEAVIEASLSGPVLRFEEDTVIALTGADMTPLLNGKPCPMYASVRVHAGDELSMEVLRFGCRAYIAFAGGLMTESVMGSRSTDLKAQLGGLSGRALKTGDRLEYREKPEDIRKIPFRQMEPPAEMTGECEVRVVLGPEEERFTEAGKQTFFSSEYTVSSFDRMGCRTEGAAVEHVTDANVISNGISFGAVQIPDSGQPIIMLSDRQTVGGYTKIGTVINVDMPLVAQCKTGDRIRFRKIGIEEAQELYIRQKKAFQELRNIPGKAVWPEDMIKVHVLKKRKNDRESSMKLSLNGKVYEINIREEL